jgi:hypothetical protein
MGSIISYSKKLIICMGFLISRTLPYKKNGGAYQMGFWIQP